MSMERTPFLRVDSVTSTSNLQLPLYDEDTSKKSLKDKFKVNYGIYYVTFLNFKLIFVFVTKKKAIIGDLDYFKYWLEITKNSKEDKYKHEIKNARDDNKLSVLHYAAKYYHLDLCKILVDDYELGINISLF